MKFNKRKLTDIRFWTSTLALFCLILQSTDTGLDLGKFKVIIDAVLIYGVSIGILHDYSDPKGDE